MTRRVRCAAWDCVEHGVMLSHCCLSARVCVFPEDAHVAELPIHNRMTHGVKTAVCVCTCACARTHTHTHYGTECDSPAGGLCE